MTNPTLLTANPGSRSATRRLPAQTVREAYAVWSRRHADCAAALFDEHFVLSHVAPMLQDGTAVPSTPEALASLWSRQVSLSPAASARLEAAILPAAADFLVELRRAGA